MNTNNENWNLIFVEGCPEHATKDKKEAHIVAGEIYTGEVYKTVEELGLDPESEKDMILAKTVTSPVHVEEDVDMSVYDEVDEETEIEFGSGETATVGEILEVIAKSKEDDDFVRSE